MQIQIVNHVCVLVPLYTTLVVEAVLLHQNSSCTSKKEADIIAYELRWHYLALL